MIALISALVAIAAAALVVSVAIVLARREARVERRLAGYEVAPVTDAPLTQSEALAAETGVVKQAVEWTADVAGRVGVLGRVELLLEQADVAVRPAEFVFYVPTFAVLGLLIGLLLGGAVWGLLVAALVALVPLGLVYRRRSKRLREFEEQLPDTLTLLAGSMRAGFSFMQGLEAVADEVTGPMHRELQRVFTEARLGRPVEDALEETAQRMESTDLGWAVMAIRIQREVGGNLAELLDTVADTMVQRERLRRDIRSLTAEGRLSGVVLSIIPVAFAFVLYLLKPDYISTLFEEPLGIAAVIAAAVLTVVGWFWIRKIVEIEV